MPGLRAGVDDGLGDGAVGAPLGGRRCVLGGGLGGKGGKEGGFDGVGGGRRVGVVVVGVLSGVVKT